MRRTPDEYDLRDAALALEPGRLDVKRNFTEPQGAERNYGVNILKINVDLARCYASVLAASGHGTALFPSEFSFGSIPIIFCK